MIDDKVLQKIDAALSAATPGPWIVEEQPSDSGGSYITGHVTAEAHTYRGNTAPQTNPKSVTSPDTMTAADAHLIALLRNHGADLVAAARRSGEQKEARVSLARGELVFRAAKAEDEVRRLDTALRTADTDLNELSAILHRRDGERIQDAARRVIEEREQAKAQAAFNAHLAHEVAGTSERETIADVRRRTGCKSITEAFAVTVTIAEILGARDGETAADAARRVVAKRDRAVRTVGEMDQDHSADIRYGSEQKARAEKAEAERDAAREALSITTGELQAERGQVIPHEEVVAEAAARAEAAGKMLQEQRGELISRVQVEARARKAEAEVCALREVIERARKWTAEFDGRWGSERIVSACTAALADPVPPCPHAAVAADAENVHRNATACVKAVQRERDEARARAEKAEIEAARLLDAAHRHGWGAGPRESESCRDYSIRISGVSRAPSDESAKTGDARIDADPMVLASYWKERHDLLDSEMRRALRVRDGESLIEAAERDRELERDREQEADAIIVAVSQSRDRLAAAIRKHRDQKADDRCWMDDEELYDALGDGIKHDRRVGDKEAMLANCRRYIERRCEGGHWPTYAELEAQLAAAQQRAEKGEARACVRGEALRGLMLARDAAWTGGHDWPEALEAAADALADPALPCPHEKALRKMENQQ